MGAVTTTGDPRESEVGFAGHRRQFQFGLYTLQLKTLFFLSPLFLFGSRLSLGACISRLPRFGCRVSRPFVARASKVMVAA